MQLTSKHIGSLPLFLGMTHAELTKIATHLVPRVRHHKRGSTIVSEAEPCVGITYITDGWVERITRSLNNNYEFREHIPPPFAIEPDKTYGLSSKYRSTYIAHTVCASLSIIKEDLMPLLDNYIIVRLNYLNMLCRMNQELERKLWIDSETTPVGKLIQFIKYHSTLPTGKKVLRVKLEDLAAELSINRRELNDALNSLSEADKIIHRRGMIEIPELQLL